MRQPGDQAPKALAAREAIGQQGDERAARVSVGKDVVYRGLRLNRATNEEFKSHVCVVRDRAEKKSRGVVFVKRTPEQIRQAEDAAIERERVRTLNEESSRSLLAAGTVGEKVAEVLEGPAPSSPSPLPRELKEETYQEDADFDLISASTPAWPQMFRDRIRGIRVECPAHKASKWKHFVTDGGLIVPDKFSFFRQLLDERMRSTTCGLG